jgi:hypothetical protein
LTNLEETCVSYLKSKISKFVGPNIDKENQLIDYQNKIIPNRNNNQTQLNQFVDLESDPK